MSGRNEAILANLARLGLSRDNAEGSSVIKASAFTIAAFDSMPTLLAIARAALRATTDEPGYAARAVEHSHLCAIWVELDDVGTPLQPIGNCDCGLSDLDRALDALSTEAALQRPTPEHADDCYAWIAGDCTCPAGCPPPESSQEND